MPNRSEKIPPRGEHCPASVPDTIEFRKLRLLQRLASCAVRGMLLSVNRSICRAFRSPANLARIETETEKARETFGPERAK